MSEYQYPFTFFEGDTSQVRGCLELDSPLPYRYNTGGSGFYRPGKIKLAGGAELDLVLYHSAATSAFIYLRDSQVDPNLLTTVGLSAEEIGRITSLRLPGQLCMGADRYEIDRPRDQRPVRVVPSCAKRSPAVPSRTWPSSPSREKA